MNLLGGKSTAQERSALRALALVAERWIGTSSLTFQFGGSEWLVELFAPNPDGTAITAIGRTRDPDGGIPAAVLLCHADAVKKGLLPAVPSC